MIEVLKKELINGRIIYCEYREKAWNNFNNFVEVIDIDKNTLLKAEYDEDRKRVITEYREITREEINTLHLTDSILKKREIESDIRYKHGNIETWIVFEDGEFKYVSISRGE